MTDPAQLPIGSRHVFALGTLRETFIRVPNGWNGCGSFWDDASFAAEGWTYLRPAD